MDYADISGRADMLKDAVLEVLQQHDNKYLNWFLDTFLFNKYTASLFQQLAGFATDMSADKNPVPGYRNMLEEYEAFKQKVFDGPGHQAGQCQLRPGVCPGHRRGYVQRRHPGPEG